MEQRGSPTRRTPATSVVPPVEEVCSQLIRFDTSNPGGSERPAAEYVADLLSAMRLEPVLLEAAPHRSNVVVRVPGADPAAPALLVHAHLDTVPAEARAWRVHPTSGEIAGEEIWGRGAVDMKNAVAMTLSALGDLIGAGEAPGRDLVLAFVADEEAGGRHGAAFLVHEHRELFDGCAVAIGEVGGFDLPSADGVPTFAISVVDKGLRWYELRQTGVAGHGSMIARNNPITGLLSTLQAVLDAPRGDIVLEPMRLLAEALAARPLADAAEVRTVLTELAGSFRPMLEAGLQNTVNATRLGAGYRENVIPSQAWARLDCRYLPGHEEALHHLVTRALPPSASAEVVRRSPAVTSDHADPWFGRLAAAVRAVVPGCRVAPYVFSGGTDNKWFAELGVPTFGFTPMRLPAGYDFPAMFHGVDERVPVASLRFGARVLTELFRR